MSEITVRPLGVEEWDRYRTVRLTALQESPEAFVASYAEEAAEPEEFWRARMQRSTRLLAERDGEALGIASVGAAGKDVPESAQLFGLWVHPEARGSGVATALVRAGARVAAEEGRRHLLYWVGTDNGRAVAFASGFGFRPTGMRRPMRVVSEDDGEEELAMTLPLTGDRGGIPDF
jgi:ribosomal protein S18 acetylase RimI-like enzyme